MCTKSTRPFFRALYCKQYTRWIKGLGTRLPKLILKPYLLLLVMLVFVACFRLRNVESKHTTEQPIIMSGHLHRVAARVKQEQSAAIHMCIA